MLYDFLFGDRKQVQDKRCDSNLIGFRKRKFLLAHEKIAHYKVEACQGGFVINVEGFASYSFGKRLKSLPVHSRLLNLQNLDPRLNFRLLARILFLGKITNQFLHLLHSQINTG